MVMTVVMIVAVIVVKSSSRGAKVHQIVLIIKKYHLTGKENMQPV